MNIKFPNVIELKKKSDAIVEIFRTDFPRFGFGKNKGFQISIGEKEGHPNFKTLEEDDNILFKTEDGQIELLISSDNINLSIEGEKYKSYKESFKVILDRMLDLFKILSVDSITSCSLRKINLIEFGYNEQLAPNGILKTLLNSSIVYNEDAFLGLEYITQNIHNLEFRDGNYILDLKYGMNTLPIPEKKIGQLIVDSNIILSTDIESEKLDREVKILNDELFNVFSWIFNDDAKKILKNVKNE